MQKEIKKKARRLAVTESQNLTINHVQVLDALAELGFQLFYCPTCEYADFYVLVRRAGGLPTGGFDD